MSRTDSPLRYSGPPSAQAQNGSTNLAELLERILDKGIVIAGDISISLVDIELLTIKLRLLISSVDKAREIGVNWWESDPWLTGRAAQQAGDERSAGRADQLEQRLDRIEQALSALTSGAGADGAGRDE